MVADADLEPGRLVALESFTARLAALGPVLVAAVGDEMLLSHAEVAALLGVSTRTLRRMVEEGTFPPADVDRDSATSAKRDKKSASPRTFTRWSMAAFRRGARELRGLAPAEAAG